MPKMSPVVHFEMPADDKKRMSRFYESAFGWQTQMLGEDMGHYVLATTTPSDKDGHPQRPGAINGGFYGRSPEMSAVHPTVVLAVEDIEASMQAVTKAGGKVLGEPMPIPGVGRYVAFTDTEGNRVAMLQPLPRGGTRSAG